MAFQRILIRTHHMTSRKKIAVITRAAKQLGCSVALKVGSPPGIMLCEGDEERAAEWETVVRKLRYKDMSLMKRDRINEMHMPALGIKEGDVLEHEGNKEFGKFLEKDPSLFQWWRAAMGYIKDTDRI